MLKKFLGVVLCVSLMLSFMSIPVKAAEVEPRLNNVDRCNVSLNIKEGVASCYAAYEGRQNQVKEAIVTTKLEKQVFWFFWEREYEWIDASIEDVDSFTHTYGVSSGTYRITVTFEITGTDGTTDTITEQREASC